MNGEKPAVAPLATVKVFAKKHRISIEDAQKILDEYGDNLKSASKAARRIAA